jgi:hypothetical protein
MGVGLGRLAMCRTTRVADADRAQERRGGELGLEVLKLAFGAPALDRPPSNLFSQTRRMVQ